MNQFILDDKGDHAFGALRMYSKLMMRIKEYKAHASLNPLASLSAFGNLVTSSLNVDRHRIVNVAGPKDTWGTKSHVTTHEATRGRFDHHGLGLNTALQRMKIDPHAQRPNRFFANREHEKLFQRLYPTLKDEVEALEKGATPQSVIALQTKIANANSIYNGMSPDTKAYFYAFCKDRQVLP
jgi:hypothetical protein